METLTETIICDYSDGDSDFDGWPLWSYNCKRPATYEFTGVDENNKILWQCYYCGDCAQTMRDLIEASKETVKERLI